MSRDEVKYSARTSWVAFFTLPLVVFGERAAYTANRAVARDMVATLGDSVRVAVAQAAYAQFAGMFLAALATLVFGPHLVLGGALVMVVAGSGWLMSDPSVWPLWFVMVGHGMSLVAVLAAMGASGSGGVPGLRYAMVFGLYAMSNLAYMVVPLIPAAYPWAGLALCAVGLLLLPIPLLTWWFSKKQPRPPDEGATFRVAGAALLLFVLLLSAKAVWALLDPIRVPADPTSTMGLVHQVANPVTVITVTLLTIPVLLVLQFLKQPARVGVLSGAGALLMSTAAVLTWSMGPDTPAIVMLVIVAIGEVFIYPWAYARMVSDAHWRFTGFLALCAMLPRLLVTDPQVLTAVGAAMVLALLAIPIGALGWFADEWIFGDELGPEPNRHGRRR
ncbi:MAG: hypothetical protein H6737_28385 [Alphaproteobacteria bacterium]|nr:hypothetical protein [Alphaproteobacteria bacterium]